MADFANTPHRLWVYLYTGTGTAQSLDHMVRLAPTNTGIANALAEAEGWVDGGEGRFADLFLQREGLGDRLVRTVKARDAWKRETTDFFDRCKDLRRALA